MKAIVLKRTGGGENLIIQEVARPIINENEVLVEVRAISVNPVDFKVRSNEEFLTMIYGEKRPAILGWDIAGTVIQAGNKDSELKVGDRVFGLVNFFGRGNGYAQYVAAPVEHLAKIPKNTSFEEAAASTLAAVTALQVLKGRINTGDRVLVHGGSGGVGHFAVQIAKLMDAHVIATSSAKNRVFIMGLGADQHIDYRTESFGDLLSNIDFVVDLFGGDVLENSIKVTKKGGTVISLAVLEIPEHVQRLADQKGINVQMHMVQSNREDMDIIKDMLQEGTLKPHVSKTLSFEEMSLAHLELESERTVGKIVVTT